VPLLINTLNRLTNRHYASIWCTDAGLEPETEKQLKNTGSHIDMQTHTSGSITWP